MNGLYEWKSTYAHFFFLKHWLTHPVFSNCFSTLQLVNSWIGSLSSVQWNHIGHIISWKNRMIHTVNLNSSSPCIGIQCPPSFCIKMIQTFFIDLGTIVSITGSKLQSAIRLTNGCSAKPSGMLLLKRSCFFSHGKAFQKSVSIIAELTASWVLNYRILIFSIFLKYLLLFLHPVTLYFISFEHTSLFMLLKTEIFVYRRGH